MTVEKASTQADLKVDLSVAFHKQAQPELYSFVLAILF